MLCSPAHKNTLRILFIHDCAGAFTHGAPALKAFYLYSRMCQLLLWQHLHTHIPWFSDYLIISEVNISKEALPPIRAVNLGSDQRLALFTMMRNRFIVLDAFEICHIGFCVEHLSTPQQQWLKYEPP